MPELSGDAHRIVATAYGRCFVLNVPESLAAQAVERMPFGWSPTQDAPERRWTVACTERGWRALADDVELADTATAESALAIVIGDLELWVAEHAEGLVFVHAGAVAWQGRAIVVPGRTLAGKSTLVSALVLAGATYYSDEYTVIGRDGLVRPYARMLSMRPDGGGPGRRTPVEEFGGEPGSEPVPLGLVAHLRYDAAAGWVVAEMSRGQTALALIDNTIAARTRPVDVMDHVQAATAGVRGIAGTRGEAADAARRLLSL
jgi:hypothetical protein